jgi:hypothetical protein
VSRFVPADYLALALDEVEAARRAHLSLRHAISAAVALDHLPDRVFAAYRETKPAKVRGAPDLPHYCRLIESECPDVGLLHQLCFFHREGPRLVRHPVPVTTEGLEKLDIADFMVCLYNDHAVETILLRDSDGSERVFNTILANAEAWWKSEFDARGL